jgi:hypothetical protein
VTSQDQLQWEARLGRPTALAAFAAALLLVVGTVLLQSVFEDREGIRVLPDSLLSANESPGTVVAAASLQALAALALIPVFYYLFRATVHRSPQIPRWFVYLVFLGPFLYALSQILGAIDRIDAAEVFAGRESTIGDDCPAIRGQAGEDCASDILSENVGPLSVGAGLAGNVGVAFLFVMLPLRARRAGLFSPFMSILGVVTGVLLVLQLVPLVPVVIEAFWLGAVGALYLGNWPGGRGPAWESGEAEPWPTPAGRRGLLSPRSDQPAEEEAAPEPATAAEPEPVPERPSSRKRKRKRR